MGSRLPLDGDSVQLVKTEDPQTPLARLAGLPVLRQVGLMVGLALSVALGVAVVLWSQTPQYAVLFPTLADQDVGQIMDALQRFGIDYRIENSSGTLLVPADELHLARIKLASQGLPKTAGTGFELLEKDQGFGTSRFMERARYQHALEGELARSVAALDSVQGARVHLAIPKQSVFVRERKKPSGSVVVDLYQGRALSKEQVQAIVHMVAASVPELEAARVTVIDHQGRVLNSQESDREMALTSRQFEYTKRLEEHYVRRIEEILTPIMGPDRVRAQVALELDFTVTEKTQELFNPDLPAVRSEQISQEHSRLASPQGIPGALSNQPPGGGQAPEVANAAPSQPQGAPVNSSSKETRNFELDRTISHSRLASGRLKRLSAAVVVDDLRSRGADGAWVRTSLSAEQIERVTNLVKQAVAFDARRGDSINVVNASFQVRQEGVTAAQPPLWQQPWLWNVVKQMLAALLVLILVISVLRPLLRFLLGPDQDKSDGAPEEAESEKNGQDERIPRLEGGGTQTPRLPADDLSRLEGPPPYEHRLEVARSLVREDPKRVAQLVKNWIAENER